MVYAEIELINGADLYDASRHLIGEEEVRSIRVNMLVDSGSWLVAINENIQEYLKLPFKEKRPIELGNGEWKVFDIVGPVEVRFANRKAVCNAFLLPGDSEPLLGSIPMEEMDVLIDTKRQELVVNPKHPDFAVLRG